MTFLKRYGINAPKHSAQHPASRPKEGQDVNEFVQKNPFDVLAQYCDGIDWLPKIGHASKTKAAEDARASVEQSLEKAFALRMLSVEHVESIPQTAKVSSNDMPFFKETTAKTPSSNMAQPPFGQMQQTAAKAHSSSAQPPFAPASKTAPSNMVQPPFGQMQQTAAKAHSSPTQPPFAPASKTASSNMAQTQQTAVKALSSSLQPPFGPAPETASSIMSNSSFLFENGGRISFLNALTGLHYMIPVWKEKKEKKKAVFAFVDC